MRTETIKICTFEELSIEAQGKAIQKVCERMDHYFIWDEAQQTVKAFHEVFNTKEGWDSWLDVRTNHIDDNILELTGIRLRTYILNNYGDQLFERKYLKHGKLRAERPKYHRMRKVKEINQGPNKGLFSVSYYSNIQKSNDCVLTGVCYDHSILYPIYEFLKKPDNRSFQDLLEECLSELKKDIEQEIEYRESEEGIKEEIESRGDYEFYEDGSIY